MICPHCSKPIQMFEESGIEENASKLGIDFLGKLPFDPAMNRLADQGRIEDYSSPETTELARKVGLEINKLTGIKASPIAWKKTS